MNGRFVAMSLASLVVCAASGRAQAQQRQTEERELSLMVGEQTSIPAAGVDSYSEGRPGIVDVRVAPDGSQFVVVALAPGGTTLLLIMQNGRQVQYRIQVRSAEDAPSAVEAEDNIRLDFYFVQVAESYVHQIGIAWPTALGGPEVATFNAAFDFVQPQVLGATAVITNLPLPRIDLLQSSGWARVLRQVALITVNGNNASYESGGQVNIPVAGSLAAELRQVNFGSELNVLPRYDEETRRIELRIRAEVADLTDDRGTGVPGRNVSTLDTKVNLEMGQSVMLAGLMSESRSQSRTGIPGLSQIPFIGALFGSHARRNEGTQNVLFIVPTVVDGVSMDARRMISEAFNVYWRYRGDLDEVQMVPTPGNIPSAAYPGAETRIGAQ